jgi:hypothetical protein
MMTLIAVDPTNPLIPKLARSLQEAKKKGGAWNSTQEVCLAFVLSLSFSLAIRHRKPFVLTLFSLLLIRMCGCSWPSPSTSRPRRSTARTSTPASGIFVLVMHLHSPRAFS